MPWTAKLDDTGPCNGDVIVRTAKGSLVAVIYAAATPEETMRRGNALLRADPDAPLRDPVEALKAIACLRPAGDIDAATGTRALVKEMERIALAALEPKLSSGNGQQVSEPVSNVELSVGEKQIVTHLSTCAESSLGSGSYFNQGVVRGLEIAVAQIQHGHHREQVPA